MLKRCLPASEMSILSIPTCWYDPKINNRRLSVLSLCSLLRWGKRCNGDQALEQSSLEFYLSGHSFLPSPSTVRGKKQKKVFLLSCTQLGSLQLFLLLLSPVFSSSVVEHLLCMVQRSQGQSWQLQLGLVKAHLKAWKVIVSLDSTVLHSLSHNNAASYVRETIEKETSAELFVGRMITLLLLLIFGIHIES